MTGEKQTEYGTADSMEAAAAVLGRAEHAPHRLSVDDVKRAKAGGCPAFRGSRVYLDELVAWWDDNSDTLPTGDAELDNIQRQIQQEKLRKQRFENDTAEGLYIRKADLGERLTALGLEIKAILRRKLEDENPDRCAGKTREQILQINRAHVDEICRTFQEGVEKW